MISVDTKNKELVGRFGQAGREWQPSGIPEEVSTYDFPAQAEGKAIPYGVYDIADDSAWVSVGIDHDTSVFAVATIKRWWQQMGNPEIPTRTTTTHHRRRWWIQRTPSLALEYELAHLTAATGLHITVCHYPPGTSKWNNRLFSRITCNWRGRPLESYQTIVNLIANTTTTTGLTVRADLDHNTYPTKIKLTDQQKKSIPITRHDFHGDWNYTIQPPNE